MRARTPLLYALAFVLALAALTYTPVPPVAADVLKVHDGSAWVEVEGSAGPQGSTGATGAAGPGNVEDGTANGQMLYWDGATEWLHTEVTELYWDDADKSLFVGADSATTGHGLQCSADALTTGNALDVTSTSSALSSGDVIAADHTATFTGDFDLSGSVAHVSRATTVNDADSVYFADTFLENPNLVLDGIGYTVETGDGWTEIILDGTCELVGTTLSRSDDVGCGSGEGVAYTADAAAGYGLADYEIEVEFEAGPGSTRVVWLLGRVQDASNFYALRMEIAFAAIVGEIGIYKLVAGAWTQLAVASGIYPVTLDVIKFRLYGSTLTALKNGIVVCGAVDASHAGAGEAGYAQGDIGYDAADLGSSGRLEYFNVTELNHVVSEPTILVEYDRTETAGTITDIAPVVRYEQNDTGSEAELVSFVNQGTGLTARFNSDGTAYDPAASVIDADGDFGIGFLNPQQPLCLNGQLSINSEAGTATAKSEMLVTKFNAISAYMEVRAPFYGSEAYYGAAFDGAYIESDKDILLKVGNRATTALWLNNNLNHDMTGGLLIDQGEDDEVLMLQAHSTQTTDIFVAEDSAGVDLVAIDGSGNVSIVADSILAVDPWDWIYASSTPGGTFTGDFLDSPSWVIDFTIYYAIEIPWQQHGTATTIQSLTFYFTLAGGGEIIENNLYVRDVSANSFTSIDDDGVAISAGTSHSSAGLSRAMTADEALILRISGVAGEGSITLNGIKVTYDTE